MASEDLIIRLGLKGQQQVSRGLRQVKGDAQDVGEAADSAGAKAVMMGAQFSRATDRATVSLGRLVGAIGIVQGARGLGRLVVAGVKWGLSFNAQVESARIRFQNFTTDVDGLTNAVKRIDKTSQFTFADLADQAALLGNFGVKAAQIPALLQGIANAAAASGQGTEGLKRIALDLGQIQSQGKVTGDELRDLAQAGAPVADVLRKTFGLTDKQMQNVGSQGLDATKFLRALTVEWNSGRLAGAAQRQLKTLGGQWMLLTGNMQRLSGAATEGLSSGLEHDVLPAANRAVEQITAIFGDKGLSDKQKLRRARDVIKGELGPVAEDIKQEIDKADIPAHLGDLIRKAAPYMAGAAREIAPDVVQAFATAWLHSGPWVQLLTALKLWTTIGAPGIPGRGGRGGGLGGALGKAAPVPVFVTNWGGAPGGGGGKSILSKAKDAVKTAGPALAATASRAAPVAGPFAAALGTDIAIAELLNPYISHGSLPTRGVGGSNPSNPAGAIPAPGFGNQFSGAMPISTHAASAIGQAIAANARFSFTFDGQQGAASVARSNAKKKARK